MAEITQEELKKWLDEQEKNEPNESVLKTFKWFLMKIEKADKYANKVIKRKLMSEDSVIKYIVQAIESEGE